MGVLIKENIHGDREKPTVTQTWRTTASTVVAEMRAFLGGAQFIGGVLQWVPPAVHGETGLICLTADADRDYGADGLGGADLCDLVVQYGIPERDEEEDQELGSVEFDIGGDMIQLERGAYTFTEGSKSGEKLGEEDVRPFVFVGTQTVSATRNFVLNPNLAGLSAMAGRINSSTLILPGGQTAATGTARFEGAKASRKFSTDGHRFYTLDYKFTVASHHWNKVFDGTQYSSVNPPLYQSANLNSVFSM